MNREEAITALRDTEDDLAALFEAEPVEGEAADYLQEALTATAAARVAVAHDPEDTKYADQE